MCFFSFSRISLFFFKQKTAYEMRISDWSSDVCSSDLFSTPASAQLLGGSGGLGGGLGGTIGGTLGNPTGPIGGTLGTASDITGSGRGDAQVDRRPGRVQARKSVV